MMDLLLHIATLVSMLAFSSADCTLPEEIRQTEGVIPVEDKELYNLWESVFFQCSEGYKPLLQEFSSFCTDQNVFDPDPTIFSCLKTCSPPTVDDDTSFSTDGSGEPADVYQAYQVIQFTCSADVNVGYLEEDVQPLAYCSNGEWEPSVFPDCKVSCPVPSLQNDTVYGSPVAQDDTNYIRHNTSISYECIDGIPGGFLQGPTESVCDDGQFGDQTTPDCKVSCESPSGLAPSGVTDHDVAVNFTCTADGVIQDGSDVLCEDGYWSKEPVCSFLCPGRDEYYMPLNFVSTSSRVKRSHDNLQEIPISDDRLVGMTAGLVAMVTTTTAVGFATAAIKLGDHFSEFF